MLLAASIIVVDANKHEKRSSLPGYEIGLTNFMHTISLQMGTILINSNFISWNELLRVQHILSKLLEIVPLCSVLFSEHEMEIFGLFF